MNKSKIRFFTWRNVITILIIGIIICGLVYSSLINYLLFHTIVELVTILIGIGVFVIAWNSRQFSDNNFIIFIGISFLFISNMDLFHTLAYKGMNVLQGYDSNLPTQLWIAARFLHSFSFLIALLFLRRKLNPLFIILGYFLISALLMVSISLSIFPDCYIEGSGLTDFKIASEYIISLIFLIATILLVKNRKEFDNRVYIWILVSLILMIGGEIAFTFYVSVYGLSNLIGHIFKLMSFYFIYLSIIETGIKKPFDLIFRKLDQSNKELGVSNTDLSNNVAKLNKEIAKRKAAEKKTRLDSLMLNNIIDDILLYKVSDETIVYTNTQFEEHFGYDPGELIGQHVSILNASDVKNADERTKEINEALLINGTWDGEIYTIKKDGSTFWSHASISGFTHPDFGEVWVSVQQDISQRKKMQQDLTLLSTHDTLTGLYNRAFFDEEMNRLEHGRAFPVSVIMADVDGLKKINDTYGHASGDQLLKRAANVLAKSFRGEDMVARIGGDEFAALLPNADLETAKQALKRIYRNVQENNKGNIEFQLNISCGASTAEFGQDLKDVLIRADKSMYNEKNKGKLG